MFSNKSILRNVCPATNPVNIRSSGGVTHCSFEFTIPDFGTAYYKEDNLTKTFSMALIQDLYSISYYNADNNVTVHPPQKRLSFCPQLLLSLLPRLQPWTLSHHNGSNC